MKNSTKNTMKASSIQKILTVLLILLIAGVTGGFYYGLQKVQTFAIDVNHTAADASASGDNIDKLQKLKQSLAARETLIKKASQLFSTDANYQSQALKDVQKYASQTGLTVVNTNFDAPATAEVTSPQPGKTFVITVQSPVEYTKLLQFLDAIEGNLPKMQITKIDLSRPTSGAAGQVTTGDITIAISTR